MVDKAEMPARYGHMNRDQFAEAIGRDLATTALDMVAGSPVVSAVTVLLPVAGRPWKITVSGLDYQEVGEDDTPRGESFRLYWWEAEEHTTDDDDMPDTIFGRVPADTPGGALADALADLERRAGDRAA